MPSSELLLLPHGASFEAIHDLPETGHLETIERWLLQAGVLQKGEQIKRYEDVNQWSRGGAETYISEARIETLCGRKEHCILKAYVGMSPISSRIDELVERRNNLVNLGIPTPRLFGVYKGTVYEEYIPHNLLTVKDALPLSTKLKIVQTAQILDSAGYQPLDFLSDLRCSACFLQIYYVDYGFDLGQSNATSHSTIALQQVQKVFSLDKDYNLMIKDSLYTQKTRKIGNMAKEAP